LTARCVRTILSVGFAVVAASAASAQPNPDKNAYFGETHVHTGWSFDAFIFGNTKTTPADAYKYATGQPIKHAAGYDIKIESPLDWIGVTDHSEYVGVVQMANTPGTAISKLPIAKQLVVKGPEDIQRVYLFLGESMIKNQPIKELVSPEVAGSVWKQNNQIADQYNKPGTFTAFCSYEWTSTPDSMNMHRNVFFRDCAKVPQMPFSSLESQRPEDLWNWMDTQRKAGIELLAISHNANLSDGLMFPIDVDMRGRPIDSAWAASRDRNERLTEIKQIKGQSETHPILSPNDEFANYEIFAFLLGDPAGRTAKIPGAYVRQALKDGLTFQSVKGFNPYKAGFAGGSDSHNAGVPYRQSNFFGGHALNDATAEQRMSGHLFTGLDVRLENPAGLTGVWAPENTRAAIFDGMQRKETFATSGPRMKVRFFGGWSYDKGLLDGKDWIKAAYSAGVPMGGDLPAAGAKTPSFAVWAVKDPTSGNLDRIQIVKGWTKSGQSFEKIFDIAWSGDRKADRWTGRVGAVGNTVDIEAASYANSIGAVELKTVWTDPEFDASVPAFYYARVLEIPTPRWTTLQAKELGIAPPDVVPATIQERAWSSPIWYTPAAGASPAAGSTVADLTAKGAVALDDAALTALIVGKNVWWRNNVTGDVLQARYGKDGQRLLLHAGRGASMPSELGNIAMSGYQGIPGTYSIKNGRISSYLGNAPFDIAVYKIGDKYVGARSNEFGYANYEIVPEPANLLDLSKAKKN
jgi:hypothetical protein